MRGPFKNFIGQRERECRAFSNPVAFYFAVSSIDNCPFRIFRFLFRQIAKRITAIGEPSADVHRVILML